jgi:hypothetical protein
VFERDPAEEVDHVDRLVERYRAAELLATLPRDERRLLRMRFYDDLSQSQIAERTGIPLGTVKMRMARAVTEATREQAVTYLLGELEADELGPSSSAGWRRMASFAPRSIASRRPCARSATCRRRPGRVWTRRRSSSRCPSERRPGPRCGPAAGHGLRDRVWRSPGPPPRRCSRAASSWGASWVTTPGRHP